MKRTLAAVIAAVLVAAGCTGDAPSDKSEGTSLATTTTTISGVAAPSTPAASTTAPTVTTSSPESVSTETAAETVAPIPCATEGGPEAPRLPGLVPFDVPATAEVVAPGDDIRDALARAAGEPDGVVMLANGVHPPMVIDDSGPVTIIGESRDGVVVEGVVFEGARDVTLRGVTVTGQSGVERGAITVEGASSGITLVELTVDPFHGAGVEIIEASQNVTLQSSRVTGEHVTTKQGPGRNVHIGSGSTDLASWVSGIDIRDNELVSAAADGIQVAGARDVLIEGNFVHDQQQNADHNDGLQVVAVDGIVIEGNTFTTLFESAQDQSIILGHVGAGNAGPDADPNLKVRNAVVANNLVHHWKGAGITLHGTINVVVVNNTSVDNGPAGQQFPGLVLDTSRASNENLRVINNVFSDIVVQGPGRPALQSNNVIEGAGAGPLDLTADPCFVDRVQYELAPSSPAIDFGMPAEAPTVDLDGRPRDGTPDAGAMELS